jgi:hypothetical protein
VKITNTDVEAAFSWPADSGVQGGYGVTICGDGTSYPTVFVEASPPGSFVRGEGETFADAERICWEKYQTAVRCVDGSGLHGPFEARGHENGAGFCVRCTTWFMGVLPKSMWRLVGEKAWQRLYARYGDAWFGLPRDKRAGLKADEQAAVWAAVESAPAPMPTTEPPTDEELAEARKAANPGPDELNAAIGELLTNLAKRIKSER